VCLCTLLFQCQLGTEWNAEVRHAILLSSSGQNEWANFQIARAAARLAEFSITRAMENIVRVMVDFVFRYGQHEVAHEIFSRLKNVVSSEHFHFWLSSLEQLSRGEASLTGDDGLISRLSTSLTHHCKALSAIKVNPKH